MLRTILWTTICIAVVSAAGCGQAKRPGNMPPLYPCTITIMQGSIPAVGVDVWLYNPELSTRWSIAGTTNDSGVAKIRTHGQFPGAPLGTFKVVLSKIVSEGGGDDGSGRAKPKKIYSAVGKEYTQEETTPLQIDVEKKKGGIKTFDIGEPGRVLLETITTGSV